MIEDSESVAELRSSRKWFEHVIEKSTLFLHDWYVFKKKEANRSYFSYKDHMEVVVENSLELANRGGVPGTIPLVEAYLNVKRYSYPAVAVCFITYITIYITFL